MLAQAAGKLKALKPQWRVVFRQPARERDQANANSSRFSAYFTRSRREIVKVQRMRYRIFSEEYGASFHAPFGLDRDRFDRHCLHLVVRDNQTGELVGYTRVLPGDRVARTGGFYSTGEFYMPLVRHLHGQVAEIGRTCIDPRHRGGAVITVLWARLARYMIEQNTRYLIGCASIALGEGYNVAAIDQHIRENHRAPAQYRVSPRCRLDTLPGDPVENGKRMPPLLKAYLRMGAKVCGEPCWDPDFNCLDYFILLAVDDLPSRYVQHFLQPAQAV